MPSYFKSLSEYNESQRVDKELNKIRKEMRNLEKESIYHIFLLRLYENTMYGDGKLYDKLKAYYYNATNSNPGEEQKDLTEILK